MIERMQSEKTQTEKKAGRRKEARKTQRSLPRLKAVLISRNSMTETGRPQVFAEVQHGQRHRDCGGGKDGIKSVSMTQGGKDEIYENAGNWQ